MSVAVFTESRIECVLKFGACAYQGICYFVSHMRHCQRLAAGKSNFQHAALVLITTPSTIQVGQVHFNPGDLITKASQPISDFASGPFIHGIGGLDAGIGIELYLHVNVSCVREE